MQIGTIDLHRIPPLTSMLQHLGSGSKPDEIRDNCSMAHFRQDLDRPRGVQREFWDLGTHTAEGRGT